MTARRAFASLISAKARNSFVTPKVPIRVKTSSGFSPFERPLLGKKKAWLYPEYIGDLREPAGADA